MGTGSGRRMQRAGRGGRLWGTGLAASLLAGLGLVAAPAPSGGAATRALHASSSTVWLCRPGLANNPCAIPLQATKVTGSGATSTANTASTPNAKKFDCFYVYPTVSREKGPNADLEVQRPEINSAILQASQFSRVCNVWSPMYRQATQVALADHAAFTAPVIATAYNSLLSAWKDYLAHDNHGHPVVFIGHSQGAAMLIKLLRAQIDPSASMRKLMVSAIILGGNVQVAAGSDEGGSFKNIPTCSSSTQTGCVIAYSSFAAQPVGNAVLGRPGQGVSLQSGQTTKAGQQVACVNPVTFSSSVGSLTPLFPATEAPIQGETVTTPWVSFPGLYTAQCKNQGGASWLQVSTIAKRSDPRPKVTQPLGLVWGYHFDDMNLALGNLVQDVATEEGAYR